MPIETEYWKRYYVIHLRRLLILAMLGQENIEYGYAIIAKIRERYLINITPSDIYPEMRMLERMGLVVAKWTQVVWEKPIVSPRGLSGLRNPENYQFQRMRKIYNITDKGREYLEQAKKSLLNIVADVNRKV
jgi:DNA-binding PadR family transcriptional regulator